MPLTHFDRFATITIQGGGVYGLNLLGQLATLVDEREIIPVALAGNSAGAIIATLYWAGLTPELIKEKFKQAAAVDPERGRSRLMDLLGPFDEDGGKTFDFGRFLEMKRRFDGYLATLDSQLQPDEPGPGKGSRPWAWHVERACLRLAAFLQLRRASSEIAPHLNNNGVFGVLNLDGAIDRL